MSRDIDGPRFRPANFFDVGVVGRRTGITMKANIKKDEDGLDNIDDFWRDDDQSDQDDNQDYDDDFSRSPRASSPHRLQYLEQELPEELLSTPTSRRHRNIPMSRGSVTSSINSARGLSLPGGNLYSNVADVQSPSFHSVKKKLVFTNDSSAEPDQDDFLPIMQQTKSPKTNSPALDRLLDASRQKNAQIKSNPTYLAPKINSNNTVRPFVNPSLNSRPLMTSAAANRRAGKPKAFDLGEDFDDQSDNENASSQSNSETFFVGASFEDQEDYETPVPSTPKRSNKLAPSARTPAEFIRKSKIAPTSGTRHVERDEIIHSEIDHEIEADDRIRFSDEDDVNNQHEEEDEDEEPLVLNRKSVIPAQKKRTASTKEPKSTNPSKIKALAPSIPKKPLDIVSKSAGQKVSKKVNRVVSAEDSDDDDRRVPLSTQKKIGNAPKKSGTKKSTTAKPNKTSSNVSGNNIQAMAESKRAHEIPVELVEVPIVPDVGADDQEGVRRSHRTKILPLEFWKNERVIVEKSTDLLPAIKAVLRAHTEEPPVRSNKRKRASANNTKQSGTGKLVAPRRRKQAKPEEEGDSSSLEESDARGGMGLKDEVASKKAEVMVFGTDELTSQVIAESKDSLKFREVEGGEYLFHRGLEDSDSIASGVIKIMAGGKKPTGNTNKSSMVFFVIKGLVQVTVHETDFVVSTGGRFLVPRGNQYKISNISKKESMLFFTQNKTQNSSTKGDSGEQSAASVSENLALSNKSKNKPNEEANRRTSRSRQSLSKNAAG
ncbi:hypothetical protein BGZ76_007677 [Entomortierella beljakovae]|nr:hypothetical protein BGZ76_007677 [Entomortierella beljakovae]